MMEGVLRSVPLRFQLGDRTLFSTVLPLAVWAYDIADVLGMEWDGRCPDADLPDGAAGYLLRSVPLAAPLPRLAVQDGLLRYVPAQYPRHYIYLEGSPEGYLASFNAKTRSTLLRKVRRFSGFSGGTINWREYRSADELMDFHSRARTISARTYQEKLHDAGLPTDDRFLARLRELGAQGHARGWLLFHGERPIAYLYTPQRGDALIYQYLGFDPEYAAHSPGTVLQWLVIERLLREGAVRWFDFTAGDGVHKRLFANGQRWCGDVFLLRASPWNRLLLHAHAGCDDLGRKVGELLERHGVKTRLRRWLRGQPAS
jgi:hypothetical protein